jgi:hypothetical protein
MHIHHYQEEAMTVEEGRCAYQRPGEAPRFAGPGETVIFKPGEPHKFWNAGESDLRVIGYIEPADSVEYLLTQLYASMKRRGGSGPDPFEAAFLSRRYRSELTMLEIPKPVQVFVFPVQVALGTLLGRYKRFADAPAAVRR